MIFRSSWHYWGGNALHASVNSQSLSRTFMRRPRSSHSLKISPSGLPRLLWHLNGGNLFLDFLYNLSTNVAALGYRFLTDAHDVIGQEMISYFVDTRIRSFMACAARRNMAALCSPNGTIRRTDEGRQFSAQSTHNLLSNNGLVGSMGYSYGAGTTRAWRVPSACSRKNVLNTRRWATRDHLQLVIATYIETKDNRQHRLRGFCKLAPVEFEMIDIDAEVI